MRGSTSSTNPGRRPTGGCSPSRYTLTSASQASTWGNSPAAAQCNAFANYLIGKNPLKHEKHWSKIKCALRKYDRRGTSPIDIALWDFAGKYYDAPIRNLLGTYRETIPAYASTYHGDDNGGLDSPAVFAEFAEECIEMGYCGFKIHGWRRQVAKLGPRDRCGSRGRRGLGDEMDLMHDPACELETFAGALKLGRALDEHVLLIRGPVSRRRHLPACPQ